jgi:multidrug efflux pump subunit AcrA (membrane-fusion protein)
VRTTTQPARIEAFEHTPLFAKLPGYVETVDVDIGDNVKRGQVLLTLRIPELRDEVQQKNSLVNQAAAELKQAEANIAAVKAAGETAGAQVEEMKAGVARATANAERWQAEYARIEQLADNGYRWKKEYGGPRLKRLLADAELDKAILREAASGNF